MLPAEVSGFPLQRFVLPARVLQGGGDVCFFVCPDEPRQHAEAFGIDLNELILGVAVPPGAPAKPAGPQVAIIAWRAPGLTPAELLAGRLKLHRTTDSSLVQHLTVAGKPVTRLYETFLQAWYFYAHGDVLFVLIGEDHQGGDFSAWTEHEPVPKDVVAAIKLLP